MDIAIKSLEIFVNLLIGGGLIYVGWQANAIAKVIKQHERDVFKENYSKISKALGLVTGEGKVGQEALRLFWEARDEARLELPDDLVVYTEYLRTLATDANSALRICYDDNGQATRNHNPESLDKFHKALHTLYDERPYEKYRRHLEISSKKNPQTPQQVRGDSE